MRPLPPLAAVRVFEAAARHGNFTRAAAELGMTQAAVSYQIKLIEERLGSALFLRGAQGVELTETGRRVAPAITAAFDAMADAFATVRDDAEGVLAITAPHSFASLWLAPRLGGFQLAHPEIAVQLDTTNRIVDFAREEVDVGLRDGRGDWPGLRAHPLFRRCYSPMVAPALIASDGPFATPADLLRVPLINPADAWWPVWFELAGVELGARPSLPGIRIDLQAIEGAAAMGGQGAAMLSPAFWRTELAAGRLVQPFPLVAIGEGGLYFVYPEHARARRKVRLFRDWLLAEVARSAQESSTGEFDWD